MPKKGHLTQSLVNAFPLWSDTRTDEQSLGYQLLNTVGTQLDDLNEQLQKISDNYFLSSATTKDLDVFYTVKLPDSFTFTKRDNDETELNYSVPSASGLVGSTFHPIYPASGNNVEGLWYKANPTRISVGASHSGAFLVASGYLHYSPFDPLTLSGVIQPPNQLWVTISGGTSYLSLNDSNYLSRGIVQVEGTTRAGLNITEELAFLYDDAAPTVNEWKKIDQIRVYGVETVSGAFLNVYSAKFNNGPYPLSYQLDRSVDNNAITTFWELGTGATNNKSTLELTTYNSDLVESRLAGFVDRSSILSVELLDTNGANIIGRDLAPEPHSNRIWVATSGVLYCYSSDLPYPKLTSLSGKNYDANCRIEVNKYYIVYGQDLDVSYIWRRPVSGVVRHRAWVEKPDGTKQSIIDGAMVTYITTTDSWSYGEPLNRHLRPPDTFTLDQRGLWTFSLEVTYADETTSIDRRVVYVASKSPLCEFSFLQNGLINPIQGVDVDSEGKLWVLSETGGRHEIILNYDNMIVDFENKIVYLRDEYDQVRIYE